MLRVQYSAGSRAPKLCAMLCLGPVFLRQRHGQLNLGSSSLLISSVLCFTTETRHVSCANNKEVAAQPARVSAIRWLPAASLSTTETRHPSRVLLQQRRHVNRRSLSCVTTKAQHLCPMNGSESHVPSPSGSTQTRHTRRSRCCALDVTHGHSPSWPNRATRLVSAVTLTIVTCAESAGLHHVRQQSRRRGTAHGFATLHCCIAL